MKTLFPVIALTLAFGPSAHAQILESDTARWQLQLSSSLFINQGNVDRLLWRNGLVAKHLQPGWGFSSRQSYIRGTFSGFKTENDWLSTNFLYYKPRRRCYPYLMGWMETNLRRRIGFRYQLGPGLSWRALQSGGRLLKLSLTGTYESTRYDAINFPVPPEGLEGHKLSLYRLTARLWAQHRLGKALSLQYEYWWQQALSQPENYRWYFDSQLQAGLYKGFKLLASIQFSYEPFVPEGVKKRDLILTFGMQYAFTSYPH